MFLLEKKNERVEIWEEFCKYITELRIKINAENIDLSLNLGMKKTPQLFYDVKLILH